MRGLCAIMRAAWTQGALTLVALTASTAALAATDRCERVIKADIVAFEQAFSLNRYGAFVPAGMMYALKRDVVAIDSAKGLVPGNVRMRPDKRPRPLILRANEGDCLEVTLTNMLMPGTLEEIDGGPLDQGGKVPAHREDVAGAPTSRALVKPVKVSVDLPITRAASFHVNGLEIESIAPSQCPVNAACGGDGTNVGLNKATVNPATAEPLRTQLAMHGSQVRPGQTAVVRYYARREGTYFAYSAAATTGGEGDGGQLAQGLFGAVNVEPRGSNWYRSQVTHAELQRAKKSDGAAHPYSRIDYDGAVQADGTPLLAMLNGKNEIIHSDLNAVVVLPEKGVKPGHEGKDDCGNFSFGNSCGRSFREFSVIMHDEVEAAQAFPELEDEEHPISYLKDGMAINYGAAGMGAMVMARKRGVGPVKDCPECRAEEFFLSSWANGDPALILKWSADGKAPTAAMYPADPSNVHHSYLGDPVRFRNIHAGPKETHVFHLHAHQWVQDASDPGSSYLDSQTISPGATFSYEISHGGSGNRNYTPGDSIFHCHLYPHFAQGMWELWRTHDVFEDGTPGLFNAASNPRGRNLPDAEVKEGTANPAIIPIPGTALAPMPTETFLGYPFYVAGQPGHRPPQPPKDMDKLGDNDYADGGLQRHVVKSGSLNQAPKSAEAIEEALSKGGTIAQLNARKVYAQNKPSLELLAETWKTLKLDFIDPEGSPSEREAMRFHAGDHPDFKPVTATGLPYPRSGMSLKGYETAYAASTATQDPKPASEKAVFFVNGRKPQPGAPYADPCPENAPLRKYKTAFIQTELTINKHGWFDPQARMIALEQDVKDIVDPNTRVKLPEPLFFRANSGECIEFKSSNFMPSALAVDDFQIYTPTDTIGQHIHLVKFDVTSSDGSGNGWNYEDATYSPEEVRERIKAYNQTPGNPTKLTLKAHPLASHPSLAQDDRGKALRDKLQCPPGAENLSLKELSEKHPMCGAQRTVQRWWADPFLSGKSNKDLTIRTVFTHDHMGPSSHQQHGLYAALVVEPANSVWLGVGENTLDWTNLAALSADKKLLGGSDLRQAPKPGRARAERDPLVLRDDGGPTSYRANIVAPTCSNNESNPLRPGFVKGGPPDVCGSENGSNPPTTGTRREYIMALADFAIVYNTALEPINPEFRDLSPLRFGRRQVAINSARPLGISSEDPGTQLFNYRNEPVPLRITDRTPDPVLGGFNYKQKPCVAGDRACEGDMANVFSSSVHAKSDEALAKQPYTQAIMSPAWRQQIEASPHKVLAAGNPANKAALDDALLKIEQWRRDFNCALYPASLMGDCRIRNEEPWRVFGDPATPIVAAFEGDPVQIRLVQGSQEAQHVFSMNGMKWRRQPASKNSGYVSTQPLGISEHFEFDVNVMPQGATQIDYLYSGSSIDQLWDGMWGVLRAFGLKAPIVSAPMAPGTSGIAALPTANSTARALPPPPGLDRKTQVCFPTDGKAASYLQRKWFDVSAVRVRDLYVPPASIPACGKGTDSADAKARALVFNERIGMQDENAIVYVLNKHGQIGKDSNRLPTNTNADVLKQMQREYTCQGRTLEPLVLRAAAGDCMEVQLRNHLPPLLKDGPAADDPDASAAHNFLAMITDGFNYNQVRMSSSVGLSPTLLAQYPITSDGSNVGLNNQMRGLIDPLPASSGASRPPVFNRATPAGVPTQALIRQGSLVPPCANQNEQDRGGCTERYIWSARDLKVDGKGQADTSTKIELGAIPLRSFGDVIKQPGHGLVGALVIGPEGSRECSAPNKKTSALQTDICDARGKFLYRDLVVVLQDSVDASIKGWPLPNLKGAEEPDDYGAKAVNYKSEPLWGRRGGDPSIEFEERNQFDYADVHSSKYIKVGGKVICQSGIRPLLARKEPCDPETTVFTATAGQPVRMRVVHAGGHTRQQGYTVYGHAWNPYPWDQDSTRITTKRGWAEEGTHNAFGPMMSGNYVFNAGGGSAVAMDYLYRSQASFIFDGGIWGLLRVQKSSGKK